MYKLQVKSNFQFERIDRIDVSLAVVRDKLNVKP